MSNGDRVKIVAEFDCMLPTDMDKSQFVKLVADYLWLCRFTMNVHRVDLLGIDTRVNIHIINLPEGANDKLVN